mmetsp:Transcript_20096/g.34607  ORF Transcript_20096/g.34607 Transcript_20096/m.34607 type:complete len:241 (+) Transcript_20096:112-834(+)
MEDEIQAAIIAKIKEDPSLGPKLLRLAFHDAMIAGPDGSILYELDRHENHGLKSPLNLLRDFRASFPETSFADLIAISGAAAVQEAGGPVIHVGFGRIDSAKPGAPGHMTTPHDNAQQLKKKFSSSGLDAKDLVVLSGGHSLGGFGPEEARQHWTAHPDRFTNDYYKSLLGMEGFVYPSLDSDKALVSEPDLKALVELYAKDQDAFFRDFALSYKKLTKPSTRASGRTLCPFLTCCNKGS